MRATPSYPELPIFHPPLLQVQEQAPGMRETAFTSGTEAPNELLHNELTALLGVQRWMRWVSGFAVLVLAYAIDTARITAMVFMLVAVVLLCLAACLLSGRALNMAVAYAASAQRMSQLSTTDVVTGGFNRLHLEQSLDREIARAARYGNALSILLFDLDNFKSVNDLCGHAAGDEVLREVLHSSLLTVREIDSVGRYGGDEFLVVLPATGAEEACSVARRLQIEVGNRLRERFGASPQSRVTLSVGVATYAGETSREAFIARADVRLYAAKRSGRNRIA